LNNRSSHQEDFLPPLHQSNHQVMAFRNSVMKPQNMEKPALSPKNTDTRNCGNNCSLEAHMNESLHWHYNNQIPDGFAVNWYHNSFDSL